MFCLSRSLGLSEAFQRLSASAPQRLSASAPQRLSANFSTFLNFIIFNSVLILVVAGCGWRGGRGLHRAAALSGAEGKDVRSSLPLIPSEADLNLGQVAPGGQRSRTIWLTNQSTAPVEIVELETSCDCLKLELLVRTLAPGQKVEGCIKLDLWKEPQFVGKLGIIVRGRGKTGERVFAMEVHVAVDKD
jgi:hypothetical protein